MTKEGQFPITPRLLRTIESMPSSQDRAEFLKRQYGMAAKKSREKENGQKSPAVARQSSLSEILHLDEAGMTTLLPQAASLFFMPVILGRGDDDAREGKVKRAEELKFQQEF